MKCAILKYGLAPEGDVFLNITFPENFSLIQNFTATLSDAAADEDRARHISSRNGKPSCFFMPTQGLR